MNTVIKYLWYTEFGMAPMLGKEGELIGLVMVFFVLLFYQSRLKIFAFGGMYGDDIDHIWERELTWNL